MTFQPVVPLGGIAGWQFLQRTMEVQKSAFESVPQRQRDVDYFRETIASIDTAEALVSDRRLLRVALGAFGLGDDLDNRFFIQKVLGDGTISPDALANRLSDRRYREMADAFGFGNGLLPNTALSDFGQRIASAFLERQFEVEVGAANPDMRLALGLARELPSIAGRTVENDTMWLTMMGNPPLRRVFETAFGLPAAFGALDLDRQLAEFKDLSSRFVGTDDFARLADPDTQDDLMRLFLARSQAQSDASRVTSPALTLLRGGSAQGLFALL